MKKRYLALFMSAVTLTSQVLGTAPVMAEESVILVEDTITTDDLVEAEALTSEDEVLEEEVLQEVVIEEQPVLDDWVDERVDESVLLVDADADEVDESADVDDVVLENGPEDELMLEEDTQEISDELSSLNLEDSLISIEGLALVDDPMLVDAGDYEEQDEQPEEFEGDIIIAGEGSELRGDTFGEYRTWIYTEDDSVTFTIDTGIIGGEISEVEWNLGWREQTSEEDQYGFIERHPLETDGDGEYSLTLESAKLNELAEADASEGREWENGGRSMYYDLKATVTYTPDGAENPETARGWLSVELCQPYYDYQFPYIGNQLPGWNYGIDKHMNCYAEDKDHPYGGNVEVMITDVMVEVEDEEGVEPDAVEVIPWDDENGWGIQSNSYGHAVVTITYETVQGEEDEYQCDVWVGGGVYGMDIYSDTNTNRLLPGESLNLNAGAWIDCYDDENGHYRGDVSDFTFEWFVAEDDESLVPIVLDNISSGFEDDDTYAWSGATVTAKEGMEGQGALVVVQVFAGEDEEPIIEQDFWVSIDGEYFQVFWDYDSDNDQNTSKMPWLEPGKSIEVTARLEKFFVAGESEEPEEPFIAPMAMEPVTEEAYFSWDYDTSALRITCDGEDLSESEEPVSGTGFTIEKLKNWNTEAWLVAYLTNEEGGYEEIDRTAIGFAELDYDAWFEWDGDIEVYTDAEEPYVVTMNSNMDFSEVDAELVCDIRAYYDDEGNYDGIGVEDAARYGVAIEAGENGLPEIAIDGGKVLAEGSPFIDHPDFAIHALVKLPFAADDEEEEKYIDIWNDLWIHAKEAYVEYDLPGDANLLPRWSYDFEGWIPVHVENSDMWEDSAVPVVRVSVSYPEDSDGEVLAFEQWTDEPEEGDEGWTEALAGTVRADENGNYHLEAVKGGEAIVTIEYGLFDPENPYCEGDDYEPQETVEHEVRIFVGDQIYTLDGAYPDNSDQLLRGSSMTIETSLWLDEYDIDKDMHDGHEIEDYTLEVTDFWYGEDVVDYEIDGRNIIITGKAFGDAEFWVDAIVDGEPVTGQSFYVNVTDGYFVLEPLGGEQEELPLGGQFIIEAPELYFYTLDEEGNPQEEKVLYEGDVVFRWDENTDWGIWEQAEEESNGLQPLTRIAPWDTWVDLVAWITDEDGNEWDAARQSYHFSELDFSRADLSYSYGGRDESVLFTDEELILTLEGIPEGDDYRVDWHVVQYDENGEYDVNDESYVSWQEREDGRSITLTAHDIENMENRSVQVYAEVFYGDDCSIAWTDTWLEIADSECRWAFDGVELIIGERRGFEYSEEAGGYLASVYVRNRDYPNGQSFAVVITSFESDNPDVIRVNDQRDTDGILYLEAVGYGQEDEPVYGAGIQVAVKKAEDSDFDPEGIEGLDSFWIFVLNERYYFGELWTEGSNASGQVLEGAELQIHAVVYRDYIDEEGENHWAESVDSSMYSIEYDNYDTDIISIDENGTVTTVRRGMTGVNVVARWTDADPDDDGQQPVMTEDWIDINVTGEYYVIEAETLYLEPEETADLSPVTKRYSITKPEGEEVDGVTYKVLGYNSRMLAADGLSVTAAAGIGTETPEQTFVSIMSLNADGEYLTETEVEVIICQHNRTESVITEATCVAAGEQSVTCDKCGFEWTEEIPATGHTAGDWEVTKEATCAEEGKRVKKCTVCAELLEQEALPLTDHTPGAWTVTKAASCIAGTQERTCTVCGAKETQSIAATGQHSYGAWTVTKAAACAATGTQERICTVCGSKETQSIASTSKHSFGAWETTAEATVFAAEQQKRTCTVCGMAETREGAPALTPFVTLNAKKAPMKVKQSTKVIKVTDLANGDYVVSWKSSNPKVAKVKKNGEFGVTIKAKKKGKATITVTTAKGATATLKVTVQKKAVKTKKITGIVKKLTLTKGDKLLLEPILNPITSQDKVTYKSSNKKAVAVNKKGQIVAKGKGKATITVKSGKKKVTCKITVK